MFYLVYFISDKNLEKNQDFIILGVIIEFNVIDYS
jgi:hypothetical protein